ncbi:speckle-type POZ protein-like [Amblyomma americanum]
MAKKNMTNTSFVGSQAAELLLEDTLSIRCDLTFIDYAAVPKDHQRTSVSVTDCLLWEDLGWLLDIGSCTEVVLNVGDGAYRAHKAILASRSPVFRAMFEYDMLENLKGEEFLPDTEHELFEEKLRFMYTGRSANVDNMADALMVAADKYGLPLLRDMCEDTLIRRLNSVSAALSLIIADKLNATVLRLNALNFICANLCEVTKTTGWEALVEDKLDLALNIFFTALPKR